jgi:hypothetical protein
MKNSDRRFSRVLLSVCIVFCWQLAFGADLISPTRSLDGPPMTVGQLSVFSEPPEMAVSIDGRQAGSTPLIDLQLEEGVYSVRIDRDETEVKVSAGKSARVSYFKGRFITTSRRSAPEAADRAASDESAPQRPAAPVAGDTERPQSPFYWPLNPKGPIF